MTAIFAQAAIAGDGHSLWSLFQQATIFVQLVMIGLIVASIVCWAIIFEKYFMVARARRATEKFEQLFWSGQSLEDLYLSLGPKSNQSMAALFMAAMRDRIPLGRPGQVTDIARATAFLCSDEAAYITGEAMNVSGGEEMH